MALDLEDLFCSPSDDERTYASLLAASRHLRLSVDVDRRPSDRVADGRPADEVVRQLRCYLRKRSLAAAERLGPSATESASGAAHNGHTGDVLPGAPGDPGI
ncbi:MAG: hypothetical protein M0004_15035 [Actinomycetota bacterium]|nr:hypothetical protein [Actinomycetota bacterium]